MRLVNNLLDVTKIKSGHVKVNQSKFDITTITKSIVNSVKPYAKQKRINMSFISNIPNKEIILDEEKYEKIMLNLLSNAFKFTTEGKSIHVLLSVKTKRKQKFIRVSVSDEGVGIPAERQKVIFDRFGQADTSSARQAEGTGLGLHLVALLVKELGGSISLKSEWEKGSTFTVLFPFIEPDSLDEVAVSKEMVDQSTRISKAISIEFSDIDFD
jgi:signal transduction histidine kinase